MVPARIRFTAFLDLRPTTYPALAACPSPGAAATAALVPLCAPPALAVPLACADTPPSPAVPSISPASLCTPSHAGVAPLGRLLPDARLPRRCLRRRFLLSRGPVESPLGGTWELPAAVSLVVDIVRKLALCVCPLHHAWRNAAAQAHRSGRRPVVAPVATKSRNLVRIARISFHVNLSRLPSSGHSSVWETAAVSSTPHRGYEGRLSQCICRRGLDPRAPFSPVNILNLR